MNRQIQHSSFEPKTTAVLFFCAAIALLIFSCSSNIDSPPTWEEILAEQSSSSYLDETSSSSAAEEQSSSSSIPSGAVFCQIGSACDVFSLEACIALQGVIMEKCPILQNSSSSAIISSSSVAQSSSSNAVANSSSSLPSSSSSIAASSSSSLPSGTILCLLGNGSCVNVSPSACSSLGGSAVNSCSAASSSSNAVIPSSSSAAVISSSSSSATLSGTFTDTRDGQVYGYVTIGTQTWMAENLNYSASGSACYDDLTSNCDIYGRLYDWATAMEVCPAGWHLPSDAEWTTLTDYVGSTAGTKLKAANGWNSNGNGTDNYGFSALPGGIYSDGDFDDAGDNGYWWSATENASKDAYFRYMLYNLENVFRDFNNKTYLFSMRCVRD